MTGSISASSSTQALSPIAARSESHKRRCSGPTAGLGRQQVIARHDRSGRVRHTAHDRRCVAKMPCNAADRLACGYRQNNVCGRTQRR